MENASKNSTAPTGVTSLEYHVTMWIVVTAGIAANALVLVWISYNGKSKSRLLSGLIVSLALANVAFCCHYLLQEVMLVSAIFGPETGSKSASFELSDRDKVLCSVISFLTFVSANAIMFTAVGIALFLLCAMNPLQQWGYRLVAAFIVTSWLACLLFGAVVVWRFRLRASFFPPEMDRRAYSLAVVYACQTATAPYHPGRYPFAIIATTANALCSILVGCIYVYMLYKTRRRSYGVTTHAQKAANWKLRLIVISIMNIICWWPACILYAIPIATGRSVYNDTFEPKYSEPALILTAAVTVANPVLYVILSKEFSTTVRRFRRRVCLYCSCFDCFDKEREHLRSLTGVNIRVYSSTSELTDTTRLLEDYSVADETNDNEQSN